MLTNVKRHWPLAIGIAAFWVVTGLTSACSIRNNQGRLIYTLDDPYIHMAIAKNFAQHGVWGVNSDEFTSSSSSPLWTFLISLTYMAFGVNAWSPLMLNVILASLLILAAYVILRKYQTQPMCLLGILLSLLFFTPLSPLALSGQEHILHALATISLVYLSATILTQESFRSGEPGRAAKLLALALAPLVTTTRYEGLFLIFVICLLFIVHGRFLFSFMLGALGALPIALFGVISLRKGWFFLPNSILLKSKMPDFNSFRGIVHLLGYSAYKQIMANPHILALLLLALAAFIFRYARAKKMDGPGTMLALFIGTLLLHMQFAQTGWFYRYEAYLVALGLFVIAGALGEYLPAMSPLTLEKRLIPKYAALGLLLLLCFVPLIRRAVVSLRLTPQATTNIYEQQYQMGLFLKSFYEGEVVAANDIGAINYLADIKCIDLYGLANIETAKLIRTQKYNPEQIDRLARENGVKLAIVYDHWFNRRGGLPGKWIKVGQWTISNNVVCGGDTVSFYAVHPSETARLIENLRAFATRLPKSVAQSGDYLL